MDSVLKFNSYTDFLVNLATHRKKRGQTMAELASAMGCQAAYLSQVLRGRVHLTEDHGVKLCEFLSFSENETDYFLVLLRKERAGTPQLKAYLEGRRRQLVDRNSEIESRVAGGRKSLVTQATAYYASSWLPPAIHMATTCGSFSTAAEIAVRFGLSKDIVEHHLQQLEKFGLVKIEKKKWVHINTPFHFLRGSPVDSQFQMAGRHLAMNAIATRQKGHIHYSNYFSANEATFKAVKEAILKTLANIHEFAGDVPEEDVYFLSLDSFRI